MSSELSYSGVGWQLEYAFKTANKTIEIIYIDPEFAAIAPRPDEEDFKRLRESIRRVGVQNKVKMLAITRSGKTRKLCYDGFSRCRAMFELGFSAEDVKAATDLIDVADGSDKTRMSLLVDAQNYARRHLSKEQKRAWAIAEKTKNPNQSYARIARRVGVSPAVARGIVKKGCGNHQPFNEDTPVLGVDGRKSPTPKQAAANRVKIAHELKTGKSIHAIAEIVGVSTVTVKKVRERVRKGATLQELGNVYVPTPVHARAAKTAKHAAARSKPGPTPNIPNLRDQPATQAELAAIQTFDQTRFNRILTEMEYFMLHLGDQHNSTNLANAKRLLQDMKAWQSCCTRYVTQESAFTQKVNDYATEKSK